MTRSLDSVAERALQRCELSGRCSDSQSSNAHHGPSTGLLGHAANGEASHPVRYALHCDRPGCAAELQANGRTDSDARRTVTLAAEARGWQISRWRDVPVDLCPEHAVPEWENGPPRVSLEPGVRDARRKG